MSHLSRINAIALFLLLVPCVQAQERAALPQPEVKPRVIISTDIGGGDEDDIQSLIHYLTYADRFDTEGIVSSPPGAGRTDAILKVLDTYSTDWSWMRDHADFPHASDLRKLVKQGAVVPASETGSTAPTQGSEWIIRCARKEDHRPLWVLVWGSITDIAQALHDAPDIVPKLRVHFIGSWNLRHDRYAFEYINRIHHELFMIHNDTTFRGWYRGGNQGGDLGNRSFVEEHVANHGALGQLFASCDAGGVSKGSIKMGDTPTVAYLLRGVAEDPSQPHWGGRFVPTPERPKWFVDDKATALAEGDHQGARTINRWRTDYLRDWQKRMDWCIPTQKIDWTSLLAHDDKWFSSAEAREIARYVISHQASSGGWAKGRGTFRYPFHGNPDLIGATFDNSATIGEIRFLARIAKLTGDETFLAHCKQGIDYILAAQDARSGGWPQEFPPEAEYSHQITFNDDAMINVLRLLRDIVRKLEPFSTVVIDEPGRQACKTALQRGIRCILRTQVIQNGKLTVWCAQHDRMTLLPCAARAYEHPSLSGQESVRNLSFLMKVQHPTPDITEAVHAGAAWFSKNQIDGKRLMHDSDADATLIDDANASPIWPRFVELGSNRPIFSDHDGIIRYQFDHISQNRRNNYSWFSGRANRMLIDYAEWSKAHSEKHQRLATFTGNDSPLRERERSRMGNREIAVRDFAYVANVTRATRIDYPSADAESGKSKSKGRIILCPSGNYRHLKLRKAHDQAALLADRGVPVTILKYRTPLSLEGILDPDSHPLDDLFELIRQLRTESQAGIDIGVFGAEAGGHLALMATVHAGDFEPAARPDFVAVADAPTSTPPNDWMEALLGDHGEDLILRDFYSAELHAHSDLSPIDFSYRKGGRFQSAAIELGETLQKRGVLVSIAEDTGKEELPTAFLSALDRPH